MELKPIQKQGIAQVVRRLLTVIGPTFSGFRGDVQPVVEVRAIRSWEEFDEGIIRWWVFASIAAVAAEFGRLQIFGLAQASGLPAGTIWTLDRVFTPAQQAIIRVGATAEAGGLTFRFHDQRNGLVISGPPIVGATGTAAALDGTLAQLLPPDSEVNVGFVGSGHPNTGQDLISIDSTVVNVIFNVSAQGRIILPR